MDIEMVFSFSVNLCPILFRYLTMHICGSQVFCICVCLERIRKKIEGCLQFMCQVKLQVICTISVPYHYRTRSHNSTPPAVVMEEKINYW